MTRRNTRTAQTAQVTDEAQTTETVEEAQTAQTEPEGQEGQESGEAGESPQIDPEVLQAYLASQGLELRKKGERKPRTEKLTDKQVKFLAHLQADGSAEIADLCLSAGATATSHGFVFRMLEHGYVRLEVTDKARAMMPEAEGSEEPESTEADAAA
jgi:hypothetical protein